MKVAIPKERRPNEKRVAATPETVKKLIGIGLDVTVESGAGLAAAFSDTAYRDAGATVANDAAGALRDADIVLKVQRPMIAGEDGTDELGLLKRGAMLVGMLAPFQSKAAVAAYARQGVDAFAMEMLPRITRAQTMDVLSSQSNLAGYKAVLDAAAEFGRAFPMMMTAAGTVPPARVLVMGAGVAGLQAIATARRLGAVVSATDVRPAAKEQVESLGGKFVMVESEETKQAETAGGYAREMSEDYKRRQAELIAQTIRQQDIVICTALIPGRKAPVLVTRAMVETMKPGSVIVDLAVEQGGNCELSRPGEVTDHNGVKIVGHFNVPSRVAVDASALYARNLLNFLSAFVGKDKSFAVNWDDEIVKGTALTRGGAIVHPQFANAASAGASGSEADNIRPEPTATATSPSGAGQGTASGVAAGATADSAGGTAASGDAASLAATKGVAVGGPSPADFDHAPEPLPGSDRHFPEAETGAVQGPGVAVGGPSTADMENSPEPPQQSGQSRSSGAAGLGREPDTTAIGDGAPAVTDPDAAPEPRSGGDARPASHHVPSHGGPVHLGPEPDTTAIGDGAPAVTSPEAAPEPVPADKTENRGA